jgi:hypothetical protein
MNTCGLISMLLLLVGLPVANAQTFFDTTSFWTVSESVHDGAQLRTPSTLKFRFSGDSILDERSYTKMEVNTNSTGWVYHSLWREDEQSNIYFKRGHPAESLIYNFSLNEGDTLSIGNREIVIDSTCIKPFGSAAKKHIYAHYAHVPEHVITWVEGVGSLYGPHINDPYFLVGGEYMLICFEKDNKLVYLNPKYTDCNAGKLNQNLRVVSEKKIWSQINFMSPSVTANTEHLKIEGDTIIDYKEYKWVMKSTDKDQLYWTKYLLIRETDIGSIYFRFAGSKMEHLFYRSDIVVGDTIELSTVTSFNGSKSVRTYRFSVENSDSVLVGQSNRKRMSLKEIRSGNHSLSYFIEGIGSTSGLVYWETGLVGGDRYKLICCDENGILVFHDSKYPACFYQWTSVEQQSQTTELLNIFFSGEKHLQVSPNTAIDGKLTFYTVRGQSLYMFQINGPIAVSIKQSGIYLYRFESSDGKVQTGKVLVR